MKALKKFLITVAILCVGVNFGSRVINAAEMNVDVGIEFTELEPVPGEPVPPSKPTPPRLPQTGETLGISTIVIGSTIILGASLLLWRRRKEVNH